MTHGTGNIVAKIFLYNSMHIVGLVGKVTRRYQCDKKSFKSGPWARNIGLLCISPHAITLPDGNTILPMNKVCTSRNNEKENRLHVCKVEQKHATK